MDVLGQWANQLINFLTYSMRIDAISTKQGNTLENEKSLASPIHSSHSKSTAMQNDHITPLSIDKSLSAATTYQLKDHGWSAASAL